MSSNETMKNKLVNSMRMTKAGTATTTTASEKKEEPAAKKKPAKKKAAQPRKKATSTPVASGFSSGCRVWPD
ncbi:MAG: hypothetical protein HKM22_03280 [Gammaproteobacteria bacterium]|nr:hypothetical protein [Gammaproteobacteria bacterium]